MTDKQIDTMMALAAFFYSVCPFEKIRSWPLNFFASIAAKEIRRRRLERLKRENKCTLIE